MPNAEAIAAAPAHAETLAREAAEAAKAAVETKKAAATAARETASLTSELAAYGVGCWLSRHRDLTLDRRKRGHAFQPGMAW